MAFLVVARRYLYPCFSAHHRLLLRCCFSDCSTQTPNLMVHYLITSCGFSPDKAARISKPLSHLKSPQNPDSVLRFLKQHGFAQDEIRTLIAQRPKILCSSPENTLDTNLRSLRNMGFSTSTVTQILLSSPDALMLQLAVPRIQFWRDFLGGEDAILLKAFRFNKGLLSHDIGRGIAPKMSLLQSHGLSTNYIRKIVVMIIEFIMISTGTMEDRLKRAKELGFQPGSGMFVHGLHTVSSVSREMLLKKKELLKSFGWSEDEFLLAVRKAPKLLMPSENNLRAKMDFLIGEVRCAPSYIASHPLLLQFSLEKRLRPRHHVLRLLECKGLNGKGMGFLTTFALSDRDFVERYILPHKEEISGLNEAFSVACACE